MSHANLDDKILDCPKALDAGEEATDLFIRGVIWCNAHLTDGRIPKAGLSRLTGKLHREQLAAELVRVGWWEDCGTHWIVHDYLEWNSSREEVEARREAAAIRKDRWKKRKQGENGADDGTASRTLPERKQDHARAPSGTRSERIENDSLSSPLHSDPEETTTPPSPSAAAAGEGEAKSLGKGKRRKERPHSPDIEAMRAEVKRLRGSDYPPACWDQLRRRFAEGVTLEDALAFVRWAAPQPWEGEKLKLDPTVLFQEERFASGLAKARASPGLVSTLPVRGGPAPLPDHGRTRQLGDTEKRRCRECAAVALHTLTDDGWIPEPHACAATEGARSFA